MTYEQLVNMGATEFRRLDGTIAQVADCPAWEHAPKIISIMKLLIKLNVMRHENMSYYEWEEFYARHNPQG